MISTAATATILDFEDAVDQSLRAVNMKAGICIHLPSAENKKTVELISKRFVEVIYECLEVPALQLDIARRCNDDANYGLVSRSLPSYLRTLSIPGFKVNGSLRASEGKIT